MDIGRDLGRRALRRSTWGRSRRGRAALVAAVLAAGGTAAIVGMTNARATVTGTKKVMVLRVHFKDYTATSHYSKTKVEGLFGKLDTQWKQTSYGKINLATQVSDLYALPDNRSAYVDDHSDGDLSDGGKFSKVLTDAIASSPTTAGLDWTKLDAIFVVMAETDTTQFHRGQGTSCTLPQGPGGTNKKVGCAIFSENPSQAEKVVWGRWAHEMGHAFQEGGPAHPSNYNSHYELMDALMPGQTGVFEKQQGQGFTGWMPDDHYQNLVPNVAGAAPSWAPPASAVGGGLVNLRAMEHDPALAPNHQAARVYISGSLYYLLSVRRRINGDEIEGEFTPNGIPDEGVLIERVQDGGNPALGGQVVEVMAPPGGTTEKLWHQGDSKFFVDGVLISVAKKIDDDNYEIRVSYDQTPRPDVMVSPWRSAPGNTWESTDIWVDSPVNGFGTYRYGTRQSNFGDVVPVGNGDNPTVGQKNRLYARVRNLGTTTATDVVVNMDRTDPEGRGINGANGFTGLGTATKAQFPGLAAIAPGSYVDVYVEYTPAFTPTAAQIAAGDFYFHTCVRVRIDAVANETVLGNQDGDGEQENIDNFQAAQPSTPGAPQYASTFGLRNDDTVKAKHFRLSYTSQVPPGWVVEVNGGKLDIDLNPGELRDIPVRIDPGGPGPDPALGSSYAVDVEAQYERELVNPSLPVGQQKHLEFRPLGGIRFVSTVVRPVRVDCSARRDARGILVRGTVKADRALPKGLRVMIEGTNGKLYLPETFRVVSTDAAGRFSGRLRPAREIQPRSVVCLFGGTRTLASAGAGPVAVR